MQRHNKQHKRKHLLKQNAYKKNDDLRDKQPIPKVVIRRNSPVKRHASVLDDLTEYEIVDSSGELLSIPCQPTEPSPFFSPCNKDSGIDDCSPHSGLEASDGVDSVFEDRLSPPGKQSMSAGSSSSSSSASEKDELLPCYSKPAPHLEENPLCDSYCSVPFPSKPFLNGASATNGTITIALDHLAKLISEGAETDSHGNISVTLEPNSEVTRGLVNILETTTSEPVHEYEPSPKKAKRTDFDTGESLFHFYDSNQLGSLSALNVANKDFDSDSEIEDNFGISNLVERIESSDCDSRLAENDSAPLTRPVIEDVISNHQSNSVQSCNYVKSSVSNGNFTSGRSSDPSTTNDFVDDRDGSSTVTNNLVDSLDSDQPTADNLTDGRDNDPSASSDLMGVNSISVENKTTILSHAGLAEYFRVLHPTTDSGDRLAAGDFNDNVIASRFTPPLPDSRVTRKYENEYMKFLSQSTESENEESLSFTSSETESAVDEEELDVSSDCVCLGSDYEHIVDKTAHSIKQEDRELSTVASPPSPHIPVYTDDTNAHSPSHVVIQWKEHRHSNLVELSSMSSDFVIYALSALVSPSTAYAEVEVPEAAPLPTQKLDYMSRPGPRCFKLKRARRHMSQQHLLEYIQELDSITTLGDDDSVGAEIDQETLDHDVADPSTGGEQGYLHSRRQIKMHCKFLQKLVNLRRQVVCLLHVLFPQMQYPSYFKSSSVCVDVLLNQLMALSAATDRAHTGAQTIPLENVCCNVKVVICPFSSRRCLRNLRLNVCRFLQHVLPQLELEASFQRGGENVDALLYQVIQCNSPSLG